MFWNLEICLNSIVGGWRNKSGHKRKHHEVTLKLKYEALKEFEKGRPNKGAANQFSIPGKKTDIPVNGPILLEKAHEFARAFSYNDFTEEITILQKKL